MKIICNFSRNKFLLFQEVQWGLKDIWKYNDNLICMDNIPVFHLPHQNIYCHNGIILLLSFSWLLKEYQYTPVRSTSKAITTDTRALLTELELQSRIQPLSGPS